MAGSLTRNLGSLVEDGAEGDGRGLHGGKVCRESQLHLAMSRTLDRNHDDNAALLKGAEGRRLFDRGNSFRLSNLQ